MRFEPNQINQEISTSGRLASRTQAASDEMARILRDLTDMHGKLRAGAMAQVTLPALIALLGALQALEGAVMTLLPAAMETALRQQKPSQPADDLLTAEEGASLAKMSVNAFKRMAAKMPFTVRLSRKVVRYSQAGLLKWMSGRKAIASVALPRFRPGASRSSFSVRRLKVSGSQA